MVSQAQDATPPALASDQRGYRVDDLIIDVGSQRVTRSGTLIALPALSFDLLVALVRAAPNLVSFEQLSERVWPGLLATPETIVQRVKLVRNALGDDPHAPRYIEAVRGRGYRMVAHVTPLTERHGASASIPRLKEQKEEDAPWVQTSATAKPISRGREPAVRDEATSSTATTTDAVRRPRLSALALIAALAVAALLTGAYALWRARPGASVSSVRVDAPSQSGLPAIIASTGAAAFSPPPHSIAVLPFVNISGDKEQEYFSDGLTEELLNSLARIDGLQVAARTSSFSFKEHPDIADVAHKLNVGAVLEGSVRRSGNTMRITAQLNNGITGFHLWSQTYDRDISDVLKLQTEIATAVASALKITLLGDEARKIEVGGTHNPAALDAYLRTTTTFWRSRSPETLATTIAGYTEAIRLDPDYALAYAARSLAFVGNASHWDTTMSAIRADLDKAQADAAKAIALAPELSEGYLARANVHQSRLEFREAIEDYERALAFAPGNARVLRDYGAFAVNMGRNDSGLTALRRAVVLDPLNPSSHGFLGDAMTALRRYPEALAAIKEVNAVPSTTPGLHWQYLLPAR